jgi:uncharacterized cupin superfamily protein
MPRVNLSDPEFSYDPADPEGFRSGMVRLGPSFGARETGASLYELPPGQALCPYHYEFGEEEWAMVLAGRPSVRTPEGTVEAEPFDVFFFPTGPEGAHQLLNDTDETVRVLMWSSVRLPTATVYPDSDKVGVWTGNEADDGLFVRSGRVEYFHGEARS